MTLPPVPPLPPLPGDHRVYAAHKADVVHVHLYRRGYQPSRRPRSIGDGAALCGYAIYPRRGELIHREFTPLANFTLPDGHEYCRPCVGHLAGFAGYSEDVVRYVTRLLTRDETWHG